MRLICSNLIIKTFLGTTKTGKYTKKSNKTI